MIKQRDEAQKTASLSGSQQDWSHYKKLRNHLTKALHKEKLAWQQKKVNTLEKNQNSGQLWKYVTSWLNWTSATSPTKLLHNGDMLTSPHTMADVQNQYYINKVKEIRSNMPPQKCDPLATVRRLMTGRNIKFTVSPVAPDEIDKIIKELKNSKCSGLDELDTYVLKLTKPFIVPSICHIINLSILTKRFPQKWKIAKVVPLYKGKGSKFD